MKRRGALALALCLTTIVGFFIVAYGTHIGFFGGRRGADDAAAQANPTAEPTPPPAPTAAPEPAPEPAGHSVEFSGRVKSVSGSTFTVATRSGEFTVRIDASTSVHGDIEPGAPVKVHGYQGADGIVTAKEVEVEGED